MHRSGSQLAAPLVMSPDRPACQCAGHGRWRTGCPSWQTMNAKHAKHEGDPQGKRACIYVPGESVARHSRIGKQCAAVHLLGCLQQAVVGPCWLCVVLGRGEVADWLHAHRLCAGALGAMPGMAPLAGRSLPFGACSLVQPATVHGLHPQQYSSGKAGLCPWQQQSGQASWPVPPATAATHPAAALEAGKQLAPWHPGLRACMASACTPAEQPAP